jgi:hypothetical protein
MIQYTGVFSLEWQTHTAEAPTEETKIRWFRWAVPALPQMYSVGGLTRIHQVRRVRAHAAASRTCARVHAHTRARLSDWRRRRRRRQSALPVCYPLPLLHPVRLHSCPAPLADATLVARLHARSNPIIRVLRFVRGDSVCLIIRTARLFLTRSFQYAPAFARDLHSLIDIAARSHRWGRSRPRAHAGKCERVVESADDKEREGFRELPMALDTIRGYFLTAPTE